MTLTSIKPYSKLIIAGVVILLIIFLVLLFSFRSKSSQNGQPVPTPDEKTQVPQIENTQLKEPPKFETEKQKLGDVLPYQGEGFRISYQQYPNIINGDLTANSREELVANRQKAEAFIKGKGVEDICSLNIFWNPPSNLFKQFKASDLITTGCPPSPKR